MNFIEGQRSNFSNLDFIGPYHSIHEEPGQDEILLGRQNAELIKQMFLSDEYVHSFTKQVFSYRINKSESLIHNFYEFFSIIMKKEMKLYFSPNYGFSLFVFDLGFYTYKKIEDILNEKTYIYFEDYITETTSFIRYHYDYRFNHLFDFTFRLKFIKKIIADLLKFSESIQRKYLVSSCIECALNMLHIKAKS